MITGHALFVYFVTATHSFFARVTCLFDDNDARAERVLDICHYRKFGAANES